MVSLLKETGSQGTEAPVFQQERQTRNTAFALAQC